MNVIQGGWMIQSEISEDDLKVLKEATEGLVGVGYEPKIVATQVVDGMNYCFICISTLINQDMRQGIKKITIYKGTEVKPVITKIEAVIE